MSAYFRMLTAGWLRLFRFYILLSTYLMQPSFGLFHKEQELRDLGILDLRLKYDDNWLSEGPGN